MQTVFCLVLASLAAGPVNVWPGLNGIGGPPLPDRCIPLTWSSREHIAWREPVDSGLSGPVIWKDTVYLIGVSGTDSSRWNVSARRLADGQILWTRSFENAPQGNLASPRIDAVPTPTVDTTGVYALCDNGEVVALAHNGDLRWHRKLAADYGEIKGKMGLASSLAQDEASVFALVEHEGNSYLAALNKQTGQTTWKVARDSSTSASSPILACIDGVPQVITNSAGTVDSYDAQTGNQLWGVKNLAGNIAPVAFVQGNQVFIGACPQAAPQDLIKSLSSNLALHIESRNRSWLVRVDWAIEGRLAGLASPIAHQGYAYWTDRNGQITCFDMRSGDEVYSERLEEPCEITPLAVGARIYLFGKYGTTTVIQSGARFEVLAKSTIQSGNRDDGEQKGQLAVAAVEGSLLIRTDRALVCIRDPSK